MRKALPVVCLLVAVGVLVWMKARHHAPPSTKATAGSGSAAVVAKPGPHETPAKPATAQVSVRDAAGPLVGATVRLSHEGDITTAQTGADGVARVDSIDPGTWSISASADGHEPAAAKAQELRAGETTKIDITLVSGGRTLTGVVTDATGGPIGGARIDAAKLGATVRPSDAIASTLTGADGHYKLTVAEGQLLVGASEPSYAPQSRYVEVGAAGATADFQLVPGGVIEGVVRDEHTHEPVTGAEVEAERDTPALFGERGRHSVTAGADGRFRLTGLRPGAYSLSAKADRVASRTPTLVGIGVAEQVSDVVLLVGSAPTVRGIVVDEHGAPVSDAEVTAFGNDGGEQAKSDSKGAFVFSGIGPGSYTLLARSDTVLPAGPTTLDVETKDVDGVKVNVKHALRVTGHVEPRQVCEVTLDAGERGMAAIPIRIEPITTAADGEFSLGPTVPGPIDVQARCPSGDQGSKHIDVSATLGTVVVDVKPGSSIAGRVVDGKTVAVAGASVMATPIEATERTTIVNGMLVGGVQGVTNSKGEFELHGLATGPHRLRVLDRGRPLPMKTETKITLAANEKKTGVTLTVDRPDGVIKGVVTGGDGKPLADAWVSLHQNVQDLAEPAEMEHNESRWVSVESRDDDNGGGGGGGIPPVLTDASGAFTITNLPRVPWTVIAEAQAGKLRGRQLHVVPDAQIQIQALAVTELKGTIKPATPLFTVEIEGPTHAQRSFASSEGTFSFGRVDPGDYTVTVTSSAGNGKGTVKVQPNQAASIDVTLAANATVVGKVVDGAGKPLAGVPIAVIPQTTDGTMRVELSGAPPTTAADGTFRVEAKAGLSVVLAMVPPRPVSKRDLQLEAGKTTDAGTLTVEASPPPKP